MDAIVAVVDSRNMHPYRQPMRRAAVVCFGMIVALFLAASMGSAAPAASILGTGCPALTRGEARVALGDVKGLLHHAVRERGVTSVQECLVKLGPRFRGAGARSKDFSSWGEVSVQFGVKDRAVWVEAFRALRQRSGLRELRGLGAPAYVKPRKQYFAAAVYVFHPRGSLAVSSSQSLLTTEALIAVARAVLRHR